MRSHSALSIEAVRSWTAPVSSLMVRVVTTIDASSMGTLSSPAHAPRNMRVIMLSTLHRDDDTELLSLLMFIMCISLCSESRPRIVIFCIARKGRHRLASSRRDDPRHTRCRGAISQGAMIATLFAALACELPEREVSRAEGRRGHQASREHATSPSGHPLRRKHHVLDREPPDQP